MCFVQEKAGYSCTAKKTDRNMDSKRNNQNSMSIWNLCEPIFENMSPMSKQPHRKCSVAKNGINK